MAESATYAVIKKCSQKDKAVTTETKKRRNEAPEDEAELNYAVVNFGKKSPSSDVINIQQNTNAPELEEEPSYVFIGSKLPSSGVTDAMEHAKAQTTQEDVIKICKQHRKLLIISIIALIILLTVIIATIIWRASGSPYENTTPPGTSGSLYENTTPAGTSGSPYENTTPAGNQSECCPEDWKIFNHSCYYFSLMGYNWSEAQEQCEKNQSNLVMIKSSKEQVFIKNAIKNDIFQYWIGLSDADSEGNWKWVDGDLCNCTGANRLYWHEKEPDNWNETEDCAFIRNDGGWSDTKCKGPERWICEKPASICHLNKP